ncbi:MAG: electron transport complex subunit RsxC [Spirochaetaceae bacterium]|nr:MAG: electron transport complex subunit RsxC [Spirochaetaceae bacterium]
MRMAGVPLAEGDAATEREFPMPVRTFKKGVHPHDHKERTASSAVEDTPVPALLRIPVSQHLGKPALPVKGRGDEVVPGELICDADGFVSARVHSPVYGKVKRIVQQPLPAGRMSDYIEIEVNVEETQAHEWQRRDVDLDALDRKAVVDGIRDAGVVGMGGATFPTHVKFSPPPTAEIDTLVINGVECEPYLTCDHRLMLERTTELVEAIRILHRGFSFKRILFGIESNKPDAIEAVSTAAAGVSDTPIEIVPLKVKYPQGAEKMLIYAANGRTVPAGKLPLEIGVVVANVFTLVAIEDWFFWGKPLVDRVITVSGDGIKEARNLRAPIGTPFSDLVDGCGGIVGDVTKVIAGGPMMGVALPTLDYSVTKGSSGLLFLTNAEVVDESPCIRCGRCVDVCPMNLMPLKLAAYARAGKFLEARALHLNDCFECGSCAYACPARIKLVAWIRYAKNYVRVHKL